MQLWQIQIRKHALIYTALVHFDILKLVCGSLSGPKKWKLNTEKEANFNKNK